MDTSYAPSRDDTRSEFCVADERNFVGFLERAIPALVASRIQTADLDLLSRAPNAPFITEGRPDLATLAAEWNGPYRVIEAGEDAVEFHDLKAAIAFYLSGGKSDRDGKVEFHFRTVANDESGNWTLPVPGKPYGLYWVREGGDGYGHFMQNVFVYQNAPDAAKDQYGQTAADRWREAHENDSGGDDGQQFRYTEFDNPAELDGRDDVSERLSFTVSLFDVDLAKLDWPTRQDYADELDRFEAILDRFADALIEAAESEAQEYFAGNTRHPKVLLEDGPVIDDSWADADEAEA